jgi:hypothetical protein
MATKQRPPSAGKPSSKPRGKRGGRSVSTPQRSYAFPALVALLVVAFGAIIFMTRAGTTDTSEPSTPQKNVDPSSLSGIQTGPAPWSPETANLDSRLQALGLPALGPERLEFHIHQHLDIFIHGKRMPVPPGVGIVGQELAILHTHDPRGVIHVESPTADDYTLGQFMDVWGVLFTKDCIGEYCTSGDDALRVYENGKQVSGDPRSIVLNSHDEFVITYGSEDELPNPIPKTFDFAPGE